MPAALPGLLSVGLNLLNSTRAPSRQDMLRDLAPFKQGLDAQLDRINEYRDRGSDFWTQNRQSLLNQAYNSANFGNMMANRMNFGTASGIQNQQAMDRNLAGVQGVGKGQKEAAASIGLTPNQVLKLVIMPQALRIIIPPTTNQYLNLTKNSSLAAAIAYPDLVLVFAGTALMQTG